MTPAPEGTMTPDDEHWFEDAQLWDELRPYVFPTAKWEVAAEEVEQVIELVGLEEGASVLDIPCGPGRHAIELARRGFEVTGVDLTGSYLEEARGFANIEGVDAEFVQADMRRFRRERSFDAALNLFSSFGYFEDPSDDEVVLDALFDNLRPGGVVVFEMVAKESLIQNFTPRTWHDFQHGALLLEDRSVSDDWGRIENRWILIESDGQRTEFELSHRLFSASELRGLVRRAGFVDTQVYGGLDGAPFDADGSRLVVVGRRPELMTS